MNLLYIEDDEIDVLAMKRLLRKFDGVQMDVCKLVKELDHFDLSHYDAIISDSNLPDGSYKELQYLLPSNKTVFISGSEIENFEVWVKPITEFQLKELISTESMLDLSYIKGLADGDEEYEQEMISIAMKVLPERYTQLEEAMNNEEALHMAAHKTKNSNRQSDERTFSTKKRGLISVFQISDSIFPFT